MNESCHTWMSHVTHEWVMLHINKSCHTWMNHVTHEWVIDSVTYEWVMSHLGHVAHERVVAQCHDSFIYIYICAMTHSQVPWLIQLCHDSFICAMTHSATLSSCVCHEFRFAKWVMAYELRVANWFICAMTHFERRRRGMRVASVRRSTLVAAELSEKRPTNCSILIS